MGWQNDFLALAIHLMEAARAGFCMTLRLTLPREIRSLFTLRMTLPRMVRRLFPGTTTGKDSNASRKDEKWNPTYHPGNDP
jgi:hypothetical protein